MLNALKQFLQSFPQPISLLIAYSGGMDSHALLHAIKQCNQHHTMRAVHINHGLNPKALQWQQHAQQVCHDLQIPFIAHTLDLNIQKGESIEAVARNQRYAYFAQILQPGEILCPAHHQDDQLETVLLQLMRGAGPKGLAAMSQLEFFAQGHHARPLLQISYKQLKGYANTQQLQWIQDDSNHNTQFDRNYFRHQVIPIIKQRFPAAASTVARSAAHCASMQSVLEDYLKQELIALQGEFPNTLSRAKLAKHTQEKQTLLLRTWILQNDIPLPSTQQLAQIKMIVTARRDAQSIVTWQSYSVRFFRDNLFIASNDFFKPVPDLAFSWDGKEPLQLPNGELTLVTSKYGRISPRILEQSISIRFRQHNANLKKIFQEGNIPPWQRWQLPLLYVNDELVAIADIYVAPAYACASGEGLFARFI
jgi:tRNA(Ile)-lysidine synthase